MKYRTIVISVLFVCSLLYICYLLLHPRVIIEKDNPVIIYKDRIVEHTNTVYVDKFDTVVEFVQVMNTDTIRVRDTVFIPIQHLYYNDTLSVDKHQIGVGIEYSGYKPSIDKMELSIVQDNLMQQKPRIKVSKGLTVCIGVGVNTGYDFVDKQFHPTVGAGVVVGFGCTVYKDKYKDIIYTEGCK